MAEADPITPEELRAGIEAGEFVAVMTMSEEAYERAHIPGSIVLPTVDHAEQTLARDEPIVVYCTDPACRASRLALDQLTAAGYTDVRHYTGGLSDWVAAGFPLEGRQAETAGA